MKRIRTGNDIEVNITVSGVTAIDGKNLTLYLNSPLGQKLLDSYTIRGNVITVELPGRENITCGSYFLTLIVNEGGARYTIDSAEEWKLVDNSTMADKKAKSFNTKEIINIEI